MEFLFFDQADRPLFLRNDAETAHWRHEEWVLTADFPYDPGKEIQRGQRIGFTDSLGIFQAFEILQVTNREPDHAQSVTAEHIALAELTNEHFAGHDYINEDPETVLTALLDGTLWSVGTVTASNTSGANLGITSVWECVRTVEQSWNVYITPRVTATAGGITGRYLDIAPAEGTWRGVRISLDKNADEVGITYDDSETVTALFGYGRSTGTAGSTPVPLTFGDVVWTVSGGDPAAKPSGQLYVEDTAATALYGRNGRPRYGFYQNGQIEDAETLLEKTWETLQTCNAPVVRVECQVRDLYRRGYADQPLRLHDTALADISPIGVQVNLEIVAIDEDLIDPTGTWVQMGKYVPNIVYVIDEASRQASGGGGRGGSGRRGGGGTGGQTNREKEISEFQTQIAVNQYEISLTAKQVDLDNVNEILREAGLTITAGGVWAFAVDRSTGLGAQFGVQADQISLVVSTDGSGNNAVNAASIVAAVNSAGSTIAISADKILLNGTTLVSDLLTGTAVASGMQITQLYATNAEILTNLRINSNATITYQGDTMAWKNQGVVTGVNVTMPSITLSASHAFMYGTGITPQGTVTGKIITDYTAGSVSVSSTTLDYIGKAT